MGWMEALPSAAPRYMAEMAEIKSTPAEINLLMECLTGPSAIDKLKF